MPLSPGQRLGPYEILSPAGAGGMGEVYRARDTRLDRVVAVKVLPSHQAVSPEARQRFEREARAVSSLNHPHICALYDVGVQDGSDFLVMEYLEGETLEARLLKGPLGVEQTLRTASEISSALDAAHRKGIIHRDLKPGNIMLTRSGAKLLDFGLAKATSILGGALSELSHSPTETRALTAEGSIVGTFQYLSPEQLEEKEADSRTDLFALGLVIYEMATGRKAFPGKSRASVIAAILSSEPKPISEIQPLTPPALDRIVRRCLAKDPDERWQSARDLMLELKWMGKEGGAASSPAMSAAPPRRRWLTWATAAAAFAAGVLLAVLLLSRRGGGSVPGRLVADLTPPAGTRFLFEDKDCGALTVSPDGRFLTFAADTPEGRDSLWLRRLDAADARPIPGTEGGEFPFWSPDSRSLAFFSEGKLKRIEVTGGPPVSLAEASRGRSGGWNRDGVILFSPDPVSPVFRVPAGGGKAEPVTKLDESRRETTHRWATFLPDGRHFLYMAGSHGAGSESELNAVYLASLDSPERRLLFRARSNVVYASGNLLYLRERDLVARPFDPGRLEFTGDPVTLAQGIQYTSGFFRGVFAASESGLLAYQAGSPDAGARLYWADRAGKRSGPMGEALDATDFRLSPDGRRFAATVFPPDGSGADVWIYDLPEAVGAPFAHDPVLDERFPVWSRDGSRIAYSSGTRWGDLFIKPAGGVGEPALLLRSEADKYPTSFSPDGRFLAYDLDDERKRANTDIWVLPLSGDRKPFPFQASEANESRAAFSPDGRWVLFNSDESGKREVYLAPFPGPGGRRIVSRGGTGGAWSRGGREILYSSLDGFLMSVQVKEGPGPLELGQPVPLFKAEDVVGGDVSADGSRFLLAVRPGGRELLPIRLIQNWPAPPAR